MKVIIFGATGMVGQGVLRECLEAKDVSEVLVIGRTPLDQNIERNRNQKIRELVRSDLYDFSAVRTEVKGYDACYFTLGASAMGMSEEQYRRVNYDLPMAIAKVLVEENPAMTFVYVSGRGTDSTEKGSIMWARVKGATENALMRLPFKAAYMFRPGVIESMNGEKSKVPLYNVLYVLMFPLLGLIKAFYRESMTTTEKMGRAMLNAARMGQGTKILEIADINQLAGQ